MALKKVYIGSYGPFVYDDTMDAEDRDGDFAGETLQALLSDGNIKVQGGDVDALGLVLVISTVTGDYTLDNEDSTLLVDASDGEITITLPTAVGVEGRFYSIKKIDSSKNKVIIDGYGTETIEGELTQELLFKGDAPHIVSDNDEWWIV